MAVSVRSMMLFLILICFQGNLRAQTTATADPGITVYQYRRVPADKRDEFVKRETTYWAEVAKKAMAKGNLTFWVLLEKVGGVDMEHKSNFLFINTYKNVEAAGEVWGTAAFYPANVPEAKMETSSLSTTTATYFLRGQDWAQGAAVVPEKDFQYVKMIYHEGTDGGGIIALEKKYWVPFIKSALDKKQVAQAAWGNALLLSPTGGDVHFATVSYDIYSSMKEALMPTADPALVYPPELFTELGKLETGRVQFLYHVVKAVNP